MADDLDPHQDTVYEWEDSWPGWNKNHISLKACKKLIIDACHEYDVDPPDTIVQHPERSISFSIPTADHIDLQGGKHRGNGGRNVAVALHEAAHHIAYALHGDKIQDHGRTFLGIYLHLLVAAKVAPKVALLASARSFGLKWKTHDRLRKSS